VHQFRVYLRAELGKLRYRADAAAFIFAVGPSGLLRDIGLNRDPESLARQLDSQTAVDGLVAQLSPDVLKLLAKCCGDEWRANPDLYSQLTSSDLWAEEQVEIEFIYLKQAEPHLGAVFSDLGYRLTAIAADPRILSSAPYCDSRPGKPIDYPVCLAKRGLGAYRLFDGIHRAIQLVRNGQARIPICFSDDSAT
jgi:hypothetical protein